MPVPRSQERIPTPLVRAGTDRELDSSRRGFIPQGSAVAGAGVWLCQGRDGTAPRTTQGGIMSKIPN